MITTATYRQDLPLRVVIADDESEALSSLQRSINKFHPDVDIVGVAHNTRELETILARSKPHAVFLDINMPGENAFQFLDRIEGKDFDVVFVTRMMNLL